MRTPLKQVRGWGSAKSGTHHWWMQRLTGIALVPLSLWMMLSIIHFIGSGYDAAYLFVQNTMNASLLFLFITTSFYHASLGGQTIIEDYVHHHFVKPCLLIVMKFALVILWTLSVLSILKITVG